MVEPNKKIYEEVDKVVCAYHKGSFDCILFIQSDTLSGRVINKKGIHDVSRVAMRDVSYSRAKKHTHRPNVPIVVYKWFEQARCHFFPALALLACSGYKEYKK